MNFLIQNRNTSRSAGRTCLAPSGLAEVESGTEIEESFAKLRVDAPARPQERVRFASEDDGLARPPRAPGSFSFFWRASQQHWMETAETLLSTFHSFFIRQMTAPRGGEMAIAYLSTETHLSISKQFVIKHQQSGE